jgi:5-oxopent-3-ene-1,2,5-tricarboxylate decarboxylase/2-hydroxyhepta-2,4-diene-1,7-dioate isomerase
MPDCRFAFDVPPYRLSGVVIGALMNHAAALSALGDAVREAPYKAPPKGPILFIKPRNTLSGNGGGVSIPAASDCLEVGASLGLVIGRTACNVPAESALQHLAGYTLVADLSVPHDSFYRPSIRFKALDGSCLIGPRVAARDEIGNPDDVCLRVSIDGVQVHTASTAGMVRSAARLLSDVSSFMTLRPGDVLMLGVAHGAPQARAGQTFSVEASAIGRLEGRVASEDGTRSPARAAA